MLGELDCISTIRCHNAAMYRHNNKDKVTAEMVKGAIERCNFSPLAKFMMKCPLSRTPLERFSNTLSSISSLFRNRYRK